MTAPALLLRELTVHHGRRGSRLAASPAVDRLSLELPSGALVAIVGESGSGKSTTLNALLGLTGRRSTVRYERLEVHGTAVDDPRTLRGQSIGIVPQDPATALDPLVTIGSHFRETYRYVEGIRDRAEADRRAGVLLAQVGIDDAERRLRQYPHELSGGTLQRVLIALALIGDPRILLADEITSNLDATVQRRVLDLLDRLRAERNLAVLLVTHDIAVAAERSSQLIVMRAGSVVEHGETEAVLNEPQAEYTSSLIAALPGNLPPRTPRALKDDETPVLRADGLVKTFQRGRGRPPAVAVDDLSLTVFRGRTLAIVGESGAGKSTALRLITGLTDPDSGDVEINGERIDELHRSKGVLARGVQLVYQNPGRSLSPSMTVLDAIAEPLAAKRGLSHAAIRQRALELLDAVRLPAELAGTKTSELSGGQQQRVAIARALAPGPEILILDEPVSALDQSVQFALLTLLIELQQLLDIAMVIVSHDLNVVRAIADEVIVIHAGRVVDRGPTVTVFTRPSSQHTIALVEAVPASTTLTPLERKP